VDVVVGVDAEDDLLLGWLLGSIGWVQGHARLSSMDQGGDVDQAWRSGL
jgi:hypothetical protein